MFLAKFFPKKSAEIDKKRADFKRIDIEDMLDQQYSCKEIADEFEITPEQVYRIKQAKERRKAALTQRNLQDFGVENPVIKARQELEAQRLNLEIEKLKFEQQKLEADRQDFFSEGDLDSADPAGSPFEAVLAAIATGYMQNLNKAPANNTISATPAITPTPQEKAPISEIKPLTQEDRIAALIEMIPEKYQDLIRRGKITEKQALSYAKLQGIPEDLAIAAYSKLKNG